MPVSNQQLSHALTTIEEQLKIIKQALSEKGVAQDDGIVGTFDGEFMVESDGKKHQVPPNYASKSMLVSGDTIRMIVDPNGGQTKYKQIGKAERFKAEGVLAKKDGKYEVLSDEGSFKVLSASIKHYDGEVGDTVKIQYPKSHPRGGWAAVIKVLPANEPKAPTEALPLDPILVDHQPSAATQSADQPEPSVDGAKSATDAPTNTLVNKKSTKSIAPSKTSRPNTQPKDGAGKKRSEAKSSEKSEQTTAPAMQAVVEAPVEPEFDDDDLV